ncbi:ABC transporter ATP-binding protein [Mesorhizobium sp. WSM2239]|uniref:ABC transporter ATP-binding protein n=2 Tax=unclassified Mesorhizobium TaxID=325217 RepID=A0AAU8DAG5_9HYPH
MTSPLMTACELSYRSQSGRLLVDNVDLRIEAGERLAIIGPNGAGKTTLLRMLAGALVPASGDVLLGGRRLRDLSNVERARSVAIVGQIDQPDPRLSVVDYVSLGRIPHSSGRNPRDDAGIVQNALDCTSIDGFSDRPIGFLSGGERQRAQLARAMAQEPKILFLDEPTNHLDPRARAELLDLVSRLPITVVAVLHDLPLVAPFATRVAVMTEGRLHAYGTPRETLTQSIVRQVFSIDVFRVRHPAEDRELTVFDIPTLERTKGDPRT